MGLSEKLTEIKSEANALLTYANEKTGASDTTLGDAVQTLIDGFGVGGSSGAKSYRIDEIASEEFVIESDYYGTSSYTTLATLNMKLCDAFPEDGMYIIIFKPLFESQDVPKYVCIFERGARTDGTNPQCYLPFFVSQDNVYKGFEGYLTLMRSKYSAYGDVPLCVSGRIRTDDFSYVKAGNWKMTIHKHVFDDDATEP